jgi:hypothetical protein
LHASAYVVVAVGETICVPEKGIVPDQPKDAVQVDTLEADQVSVEDLPLFMVIGEAEKESVGVGGGVGGGGVGVGAGVGVGDGEGVGVGVGVGAGVGVGVGEGGGGVIVPTGASETSSIVIVPFVNMS